MKRTSGKLLLLICLSLGMIIQPLLAQRPGGGKGDGERPEIGVLKGHIVDAETSEPIPFATVSLLSVRDSSLVTGGLTGDDGIIFIDKIKLGKYWVVLSSIGYQQKKLDTPLLFSPKKSITNDLGRVTLKSMATDLDEVTITAKKEVMTMSLEKRQFNIGETLTAVSGDPAELLSQVPSVEVDMDGNISLRGNTNVTVFINGRPSALVTYNDGGPNIQNIPADAIESIEVITNPSAKYNPEGTAGIINVVLKKEKIHGTNGSANLSVGNNDKYNAALSLNRFDGKWNFFTNYNYRYDNRWSQDSIYRHTYAADGNKNSYLYQSWDGVRIRNSHMIRAGAGFSPNKYNTITLTGTYNTGSRSKDNTLMSTSLDSLMMPIDTYKQLNTSGGNNKNFEGSLDYVRDFKKDYKEFTAFINYSDKDSDEKEGYGDLRKAYTVNNNALLNAQVDYVTQWKTMKVEAGYQGQLRVYDTDFKYYNRDVVENDFVLNDSVTNRFVYQEHIQAVYGTLSGKLPYEIAWQTGLRLEPTWTSGDLKTSNETFTNNYFNWFPSLQIRKTIKEGQDIQFSYSQRIRRPRTKMLNPFPDLSNTEYVYKGNPMLRPMYTHSLELGYQRDWDKSSLIATTYYKNMQGSFSRVSYFDDLGLEIRTWDNLNTEQQFGGELIYSASVGKIWKLNASANAYYRIIDGSNIEETNASTSGQGANVKMTNMFTLWKGGMLQYNIRHRFGMNIPGGSIDGITFSDIALRQQVLKKKGSVTLKVSDPFDFFGLKILTEDDNFYRERYIERETQIVYLSFMYQFGKKDKGKGKGRGGDGGGGDMDFE